MSQQLKNSDKGRYDPANPLEKMHEAFLQQMRDIGLTVTELEASDTEEYVVTLPSNRQKKSSPKQTAENKTEYMTTFDYGYDTHSVSVSQRVKDQINQAEPITILGQGFSVDGKMTQDHQNFNSTDGFSLTVDGEDGRQIYIGKLSAAYISKIRKN